MTDTKNAHIKQTVVKKATVKAKPTPKTSVITNGKTTTKPAAKPKATNTKTTGTTRRAGKFTPELMETIFSRVSGGEPLRQICRDLKINWTSVYDWLHGDQELAQRFARAREKGEEAIAQECLDIADNASNDWMETFGRDGGELYRLNGEHVQRSKLRIDTRLKLLAKWNPKKWGEKVDLNHGVQPENPLASMLQRIAGSGLPVIKDDSE